MEKESSINLIEESKSFDLIIPQEVELKIRRLLDYVHNIEWSGILFCTHTGTFEKEDLVITCRDILPLNVGNSSFTEFEMSPEVISYMVDKDLMDCDCQLIHSHHSMKAFFSGTDENTLSKEGKDRNNFVSLIVNNIGEYCARVTRKEVIKNHVKSVKKSFFFGNEVEIPTEYDTEQVFVHYYNLNIIKKYDTDEELLGRVNTLKEQAKQKKESFKPFQEMFMERTSKSVTFKEPTLFDDVEEVVVKAPKKSKFGNDFDLDKDEEATLNIVSEVAAAKLLTLSIVAEKLPKDSIVKVVSKVFEENDLGHFIPAFVESVMSDATASWISRFEEEELCNLVADKVYEILEEYREYNYVDLILNELVMYE